jgi:hypothetical protein
MRIALLSDSRSGINIFPLLGEKLSAKIADVEISAHFVSSPEDLPLKAKELLKSNDLVFVFSFCEGGRAEMVLEKLVDVEVGAGKKIIKALGESELGDINTREQFEEERERLASKWCDVIVKTLFSPQGFAPKESPPEEFPFP